jgi:UDP-glucose 4-epimerase
VLALQYLTTHQKSDAFNLGTGTGTSVLEVVQAVAKYCGKEVPVQLENRRHGEPAILSADNHKAKTILGWNPQYSTMPLIIESAWKWHQLLNEKGPILRSAIQRLEEQKCSSSPTS